MKALLTSDQKALARPNPATVPTEVAVVEDSPAPGEERERESLEFLATLHDARMSAARGEGRPITETSMCQLSADIQQRGRARLLAERLLPG